MEKLSRLEAFQSEKDRKWYWRVRWSNGRIACTSEGYSDQTEAVGAAEKMLENIIGLLFHKDVKILPALKPKAKKGK